MYFCTEFNPYPNTMKMLIAIIVVLFVVAALVGFKTRKTAVINPISTTSFYDLSVGGIDGEEIKMDQFKGKYVLCVNVASKCGYTPQYKQLQEVYEQYGDKLVILGFPCNQFLKQEPGTSEDIATFCEKNYGVTFQLTEKIEVKGKNQHPVYQWLTSDELNSVESNKVKWNFHKFMVSPEGKWLGSFSSSVVPNDPSIIDLIK
ncbi:MAG: glutathione peroxidase [Flavobacteriales bacterium]